MVNAFTAENSGRISISEEDRDRSLNSGFSSTTGGGGGGGGGVTPVPPDESVLFSQPIARKTKSVGNHIFFIKKSRMI
jgi:hypothetical protein